MKYLIALSVAVMLSTQSFAISNQSFAKCNPSKGNWVNAAKTTCTLVVQASQGTAAFPHLKKPQAPKV